MKAIIKFFFIQLAIFLLYMIAVSVNFVSGRYPNPIGAGILTLFFFFFHFLGYLCWYFFKRVNNIKILSAGLLSILLIILLYNLASEYHYHWLWYLRGE